MWSVHFIGRPDAIKRALVAYGNSLFDSAREEFQRARPVLESLVDLNREDNGSLSLQASETVIGGVSVVLMQSNAMHVQ